MESEKNFNNQEKILKKIDKEEAQILSEENSNSSISDIQNPKESENTDTMELQTEYPKKIKERGTYKVKFPETQNKLNEEYSLEGDVEKNFFIAETTKEKNDILKTIDVEFSNLEKEALLLNIKNGQLDKKYLANLKNKIKESKDEWTEIINHTVKLDDLHKKQLSYLLNQKVENFKNRISDLIENKNQEDRIKDVDEKAEIYVSELQSKEKEGLSEIVTDNQKDKIKKFFQKRNGEKSYESLKQIAENFDPEKNDSGEIGKAMELLINLNNGDLENNDELIKNIKEAMQTENEKIFFEKLEEYNKVLKEMLEKEESNELSDEIRNEKTSSKVVMDS